MGSDTYYRDELARRRLEDQLRRLAKKHADMPPHVARRVAERIDALTEFQDDGGPELDYFVVTDAAPPLCGKYLGDNDGTCPQLTCIRDPGHEGDCDNVRGDEACEPSGTAGAPPPTGSGPSRDPTHSG